MKIKSFIGSIATIQFFIVVLYLVNIYRFVTCDFKPSYREEFIYGSGLISPSFIVTSLLRESSLKEDK